MPRIHRVHIDVMFRDLFSDTHDELNIVRVIAEDKDDNPFHWTASSSELAPMTQVRHLSPEQAAYALVSPYGDVISMKRIMVENDQQGYRRNQESKGQNSTDTGPSNT